MGLLPCLQEEPLSSSCRHRRLERSEAQEHSSTGAHGGLLHYRVQPSLGDWIGLSPISPFLG